MKIIVTLLMMVGVVLSVYAQTAPRQRIGVVFDASGRGDRSFNDSAYEGLLEVAQNFRGHFANDPSAPRFGNEVELQAVRAADNSATGRLAALRSLGRAGYNVVFAVGFLFTDTVVQAGREFPNTNFVLIDGFIPNLPAESNITIVGFSEQEGSFLVGMIAGLLNRGGRIGFVGGMDSPLIHRFEVGFRAGAIHANSNLRPRGQILVEYVGTDASAFNNPDRAYQIARGMYRQGVTVIYHASGGSGMGVFRAAAEARQWAIGVDSDQGAILAADTNPAIAAQAQWILTSMLKRVNRPVLLISRDFIRTGRIAPRYQTFGLNFDALSFAVNDGNRRHLGRDITQRLTDARVLIQNDQLSVPSTREELESWVAR